jgi:hypothetical protein
MAAIGGHFELLVWAREAGAPWEGDVYYRAAAGGFLEMLEWAWAQGCPREASDLEESSPEIKSRNPEVLAWLREHDFPASACSRCAWWDFF